MNSFTNTRNIYLSNIFKIKGVLLWDRALTKEEIQFLLHSHLTASEAFIPPKQQEAKFSDARHTDTNADYKRKDLQVFKDIKQLNTIIAKEFLP